MNNNALNLIAAISNAQSLNLDPNGQLSTNEMLALSSSIDKLQISLNKFIFCQAVRAYLIEHNICAIQIAVLYEPAEIFYYVNKIDFQTIPPTSSLGDDITNLPLKETSFYSLSQKNKLNIVKNFNPITLDNIDALCESIIDIEDKQIIEYFKISCQKQVLSQYVGLPVGAINSFKNPAKI